MSDSSSIDGKFDIDAHDWRYFLLARDSYHGFYDGPDWVPHSLWSARKVSKSAATLIQAAGAEQMWRQIEEVYDRPNDVASILPLQLDFAKEQWALLSKRSPADHRDHYLRLKAKAEALAIEVDRLEEQESLLTGERYDIWRLTSEEEKTVLGRRIWLHNLMLRNSSYMGATNPELGYHPWDLAGNASHPIDWETYTKADPAFVPPLAPADRDARDTYELLLGDADGNPGIIPSVAEVLRRLAKHMSSHAEAPPLARPAFPNAERNFVTRHLCKLFRDSFGFPSPSIIARVVSMFYAQGITDNEVSKMIGALPPDDDSARQEMIARILALVPAANTNTALVERIECAGIDELRRQLSWAELVAGMSSEHPSEGPESSTHRSG